MAGSFTTYSDNMLLAYLVGKTTVPTMPTVYMALSTTTPAADGTGFTEPAYANGYQRVTTSGIWGTVAGGSVINSGGTVTFGPNTTSNWGTITYFALYDTPHTAGTGPIGSMLAFGQLTNSRTVNVGDSATFATSSLTISLT